MEQYVGPVTWYEFPDGLPKLPKYLRLAGISDDGVVYAPGNVAGNPNAVFMCAGYDGVTALMYENNLYYPTAWLAQEFPASREAVEKLTANLKAKND